MQFPTCPTAQKCANTFQYRKRYGLHAMSKASRAMFRILCFNTASGMDCMQFASLGSVSAGTSPVSIPQAVWIACNKTLMDSYAVIPCFNTASGMDCMQLFNEKENYITASEFQYRKRYGLHAIRRRKSGGGRGRVSIPQAVWIACNEKRPSVRMSLPRFNTASGMDCMQYRPSQPLGQLNPEAGFLNGSLFLANRRNLAGFFCRQNRLKTSANPVIPRKLLSTGKI